jgi:hypothetical protein
MPSLLAQSKRTSVILEISEFSLKQFGSSKEEVFAIMEKNGYRAKLLTTPCVSIFSGSGIYLQYDVLFEPAWAFIQNQIVQKEAMGLYQPGRPQRQNSKAGARWGAPADDGKAVSQAADAATDPLPKGPDRQRSADNVRPSERLVVTAAILLSRLPAGRASRLGRRVRHGRNFGTVTLWNQAGIEGGRGRGYGRAMAIDYEKQWPQVRILWAKEKIQEWTGRLEQDLPLEERHKLQDDVIKMRRVLIEWEADLDA